MKKCSQLDKREPKDMHDRDAKSGGGYEPVNPDTDDPRFGEHRCKECGEIIDFQ
jgi:hypothetical protein